MYSEHLVNLDLILLALISTLACFNSSLSPICQDSKTLLPLWPQYSIFFTNVTSLGKHIFYQYVQSVLPLWPFCSNWPLWLFTNVSLLDFYQNVPPPSTKFSPPPSPIAQEWALPNSNSSNFTKKNKIIVPIIYSCYRHGRINVHTFFNFPLGMASNVVRGRKFEFLYRKMEVRRSSKFANLKYSQRNTNF